MVKQFSLVALLLLLGSFLVIGRSSADDTATSDSSSLSDKEKQKASTAYCADCGKAVPDGATKCPHCGVEFGDGYRPPAELLEVIPVTPLEPRLDMTTDSDGTPGGSSASPSTSGGHFPAPVAPQVPGAPPALPGQPMAANNEEGFSIGNFYQSNRNAFRAIVLGAIVLFGWSRR